MSFDTSSSTGLCARCENPLHGAGCEVGADQWCATCAQRDAETCAVCARVFDGTDEQATRCASCGAPLCDACSCLTAELLPVCPGQRLGPARPIMPGLAEKPELCAGFTACDVPGCPFPVMGADGDTAREHSGIEVRFACGHRFRNPMCCNQHGRNTGTVRFKTVCHRKACQPPVKPPAEKAMGVKPVPMKKATKRGPL